MQTFHVNLKITLSLQYDGTVTLSHDHIAVYSGGLATFNDVLCVCDYCDSPPVLVLFPLFHYLTISLIIICHILNVERRRGTWKVERGTWLRLSR